MERKHFLKLLSILPLTGAAMKLQQLNKFLPALPNTETMPVLFIGHGIPTNAIVDNEFTNKWKEIAKTLPKPKAIICISAHWETNGTYVTAMQTPKTIHDYGFMGNELGNIRYEAKGNPELASELKDSISSPLINLNHDWGLDHGCWVVMRHLFPNADIPIIEMSLDKTKDGLYHLELAKQLNHLRKKGVLIVASGGSVHNMSQAASEFIQHDWAVEANNQINKIISDGEAIKLASYKSLSKEINFGVPTTEHFYPMLYALGLRGKNETVSIFNNKIAYGSFSMTCFRIG